MNYTIIACPAGGYVVGSLNDYGEKSNAFAGTLEECLDFVRVRFKAADDARVAQEAAKSAQADQEARIQAIRAETPDPTSTSLVGQG